jgi:DNA repair protein RadC
LIQEPDHPAVSPETSGNGSRHSPEVRQVARSGARALTATQLVTLLLGGRRRTSRRLLRRFGSLRSLVSRPFEELAREPGLDQVRSARLLAAFEIAARVAEERLERGQPLTSSRDVFEAYHPRLRDLRKEVFLALLLDGKHRLLHEEAVSVGTLTASLVHPREVFGPAVRLGAAALILVHNHPSGDPSPSPEDLDITARLAEAGRIVGIDLLDHVVLGDGCFASCFERGTPYGS